MKQSNLFLTRCLAVLLALALCLGNISTGVALTVSAAGNSDKTIVNAVESVAQNNEQMNTTGADKATTLYSLIAELYGNSTAAAILNSGALAGNVAISYNMPSAELVTLAERVLTAPNQASGFGDAEWVATTYGPTYEDAAAFAFEGTTASWGSKSVFVTYALDLTQYNDVVATAQTTLQTLKEQYDVQKSAMEDLLYQKGDMMDLTRMKLQVFNSVISGYDFTAEDGTDKDAKNLELRAYFTNLINTLLNDRSDNTYLKIVALVEGYEKNGMVNFFQNDATIVEEVKALSECLNGLVGDSEKESALADLMGLFGYAELVDKIASLGETMESIGARLAYTNDELLTSSSIALKAYTSAMEAATVESIVVANGDLLIAAAPIKAEDDSVVSVTITVNNNGQNETIYVPGEFGLDEVVTEELVETIITVAQETVTTTINNIVEKLIAEQNVEIPNVENASRFFDVEIDTESIEALVGQPIGEIAMPKISIQPKPFFINFINPKARMADVAVITILDRAIELPEKSEDNAFRFEYTMNGVALNAGVKVFTPDEMDTLFNDEYVLEIERLAIDRRAEMLEMLTNALIKYMGEENVEMVDNTLTITLTGSESASAMLNAFVDAQRVTYIGLNNENLLYAENNMALLSLQTLLNAVVADPEFTSERIIALAENNGGTLLSAVAQLGEYDNTGKADIVVEDLNMVFELGYAPEKLVTLGNGLNALKNNFTFNTETITDANGAVRNALAMNLNVPEKIYEAYLAILLLSYEIDQSNINDINNEIAVEFFYDYIDAVLGSENISMQTFQNTLDILTNTADALPKVQVADKDIMHLAKYFDLVNDLYKNITYYPMGEAAGQLLATTTDEGLMQIMEMIGFDFPAAVAPLVVELHEGHVSYFWTTADIMNTSKDFEALVYDLDAGVAGAKEAYKAYQNSDLKGEAVELAKGNGLANAIDFTTNLSKRASELTGQAIIVLMGDSEGDLVINNATILDLNGHTITGNVIANGHLLIVDSTMSNNQAGGVNGDVSGHVMIISGNFTDDVTAFLKDGYAQTNGMVHNELYRVEKNGNDLTYYLNSDVMHEQAVAGLLPNMGVVAAEIAVDVALNQYPLTFLAAAGKEVMNISVENIIGLLVSNNKLEDCAQEILDLVNVRNIASLAKELAKELVDFEGIAAAIMNDAKLGDVTLTVAPWDLTIEHIYGNGADYLTVGYEFNADEMKSVNVGFAFEGENVKQFVQLLVELKHIFDPERSYLDVDIFRPTAENKVLAFGGTVEGRLSFDLTVGYNTDGEKNAYPVVIAVALAYANEDNRAELVSALVSGETKAIKAAIDACSVEDVVSALKEMNRFTSCGEMAAELGLTISAETAELDAVWHFVTVAFGKILQVADVIGRDSLLGNLDKDNDGVYVLESTHDADADVYAKGYGLYVNAEKLYEAFEVKVFDLTEKAPIVPVEPENPDVPVEPEDPTEPDCLWGDVNHDGKVNAKDATLILQESVGTRDTADFFCYAKADVNGDGKINAKDATLILQHSVGTITKFPVEE